MKNCMNDNKKLNQKEFREQKIVLLSLPTRAWLAFTSRCNLRCTHCPRGATNNQFLTSYDMDQEVFQRIEDDLLPSLNLCRIGGNNLGEQLCCLKWDEYVKKMTKYALRPWLITNGLLLTRKRIKTLVENDFLIDISIDGANAESYQRIRGANFNKLINNVIEIDSQRKKHENTNCQIAFAFTAFQENIKELPDLIELAAQIGVDKITTIHFMPMIEKQRLQSLFYHQTTANNVFGHAKKMADRLGIEILVPQAYPIHKLENEEKKYIDSSKDLSAKKTPSHHRHIKQCYHPWTSVSINQRGDVFPCCQSNYYMGNLKKNTFKQIWNNKRYQKLRKTVNSDHPAKDCKECPLRGNTLTGTDCANNEYFLRNINKKGFFQLGKIEHLGIKAFLKDNVFTKSIYPLLSYFYKKIQ